MQSITIYCDLCKKEIVRYNHEATLKHQNGSEYHAIHDFLRTRFKYEHLHLECVKRLDTMFGIVIRDVQQ